LRGWKERKRKFITWGEFSSRAKITLEAGGDIQAQIIRMRYGS